VTGHTISLVHPHIERPEPRAHLGTRSPPEGARIRRDACDRPAVLLMELGARSLCLGSSSSAGADDDSGKITVGGAVSGHDLTLGRLGGGGDDQIVGSSWLALAAHEGEELGVGGGNRFVVVEDGDDVDDVVDEGLTVGPVGVIGEVGPDQELGDGDGGDRRVVIIGDHVVEGRTRAVGVDQEGGVEEESAQGRFSISRSSRAEVTSRAKAGSRRRRCRSALISAPLPACTGSSWATTLPRRTIVKCSPRCSTASRRSEKFRAASVALTSGMRSDYQTGPAPNVGVPTPNPSRVRLLDKRRIGRSRASARPPA
jgi:hypothetical protein